MQRVRSRGILLGQIERRMWQFYRCEFVGSVDGGHDPGVVS